MQSPALIVTPPDQVQFSTVELERPNSNAVLTETLYSAVSPGTELRCLSGRQEGVDMNRHVPGYQAVSRVLEAPAASGLKTGDLVFRNGGAGIVTEGVIASWGGHTKLAWCAPDALEPLPEAAAPEDAAMGALMAIAYHGIERIQPLEGERVAVIGLGLLGQFSARLAAARGAEVVAFDRVASRVDVARQGGVIAQVVESSLSEAASQAGWPDRSFDIIIDVTGFAPVMKEAIELARDLMPWNQPVGTPTRYLIQGSYAGAFEIHYQTAFVKELSFVLSRDRTRADVRAVLELLASKRLNLSGLRSEAQSPAEAPRLYAELADPESGRLSAIFDWRQV